VSGRDRDVEQFLGIIPKLLGQHLDAPGSLTGDAAVALRRSLDEAGVTDLATDTADLGNSRTWLTATVARTARTTPSVAFALAARYTAQRALQAAGGARASEEATLGAFSPLDAVDEDAPPEGVLVPFLFEPETSILLDLAHHRVTVFPIAALERSTEPARRTGLRHAGVCLVRPVGPAQARLGPTESVDAVRDWSVLTAAVSLGIAEAALGAAESYAAGRQQFGAALVSFAGLRAILAEMRLKVVTVRAMLDRAIEPDAGPVGWAEASASAHRAAVGVALDAIQVHGGYGYIEEYPVAGLLRDAVSVGARGGGRRLAMTAIAADRLGPAGWDG
jgi:hypothetical protein